MNTKSQVDTSNHKAWLKKRKLTIIAFAIQNIIIGLDLSILFVNLWVYIETLVKPSHPRIYYSAIAVASMLSPAIFGTFICKMADQSRSIRVVFFLTDGTFILGNLLYALPFSPWLLLVGRFIAGVGLAQRSIITGEIARCYEHEELTSKFSLMGMTFSLGFLIGPVINAAFLLVDLWIGNLHVTFANISGIYMSVLFVISIIMCHLMVSDLSKEFDLKSHKVGNTDGLEDNVGGKKFCSKNIQDTPNATINTAKGNTTNDQHITNGITMNHQDTTNGPHTTTCSTRGKIANVCKTLTIYVSLRTSYNTDAQTSTKPFGSCYITDGVIRDGHITSNNDIENGNNSERIPLLHPRGIQRGTTWFIKQMLTNYDTCLLLIVSFFENFLLLTFEMGLPIIIIDILKWPVSGLNYVLFGEAVSSLIPCLVLIFKTFTDPQVFYMSVVSILAYTLIQVFQIIFAVYSRDFTTNVIMSVFYCLLFANVMIIKDIFLGGFLAKMVSSEYQSQGDSVRLIACRVGSVIAFTSAPFALERIDVIGWVYVAIVLLLGILLVLRRKNLKNPKIIIS